MTEQERLKPSVFNESRVRRIAKGSGTKNSDVMDLIKRFKTMRNMMGMLGKGMGGLLGKIPGMGGLNQLNQMRKMAPKYDGRRRNAWRWFASRISSWSGHARPERDVWRGGAGMGAPKKVDRDKLKKLRKQAKDARKKNRR